MKTTIRRSANYITRQRIATGTNVPAEIQVEIDPADLTMAARVIVIACYGHYPEKLLALSLRELAQVGERYYFNADVEPEEVSAGMVSGLIGEAAAEIAEKRKELQTRKRQQEEEAAAKRQAQIEEARPMVECFLSDHPLLSEAVQYGRHGFVVPGVGRIPSVYPGYKELVRIAKARQAQARARAREAEEAAEQRLRDQLDQWVAEHGSDGQRRRHARNLLPVQEIADAICKQTFAALGDLMRYLRISDQEVRNSYVDNDVMEWDEGQEVSYSAKAATTATDEQLHLLEHVERTLGEGAEVELRLHRGYLDDTTAEQDDLGAVERYSIKATVRVGELILSREYAA